jgi:pimeloyl-ACP methyl ester carboxylesterase
MRIETELGELDVEVVGEGQPAFLWHSLCVDRSVWSRVRDDLAAHRRLVVIDAPGHGASAAPAARFTLDECADAAIQVLEALDIDEPLDWVGNAWGGHVGIVLGAREPERLRTLTTIATLVGAVTGRLRLQVHALLAAYRLIGPRDFVVSSVMTTLLSSRTQMHDDAAVAYVSTQIASIDRAAFRTTWGSIMLDRPDISHHVASLRIPTLFMTGSEDALWTPADVRAAESEFEVVTSAVIEGAAHLTALESPSETTKAILAHWDVAADV